MFIKCFDLIKQWVNPRPCLLSASLPKGSKWFIATNPSLCLPVQSGPHIYWGVWSPWRCPEEDTGHVAVARMEEDHRHLSSSRRYSWSSVLSYHLCRWLSEHPSRHSVNICLWVCPCTRPWITWAEKLGLLTLHDSAIAQLLQLSLSLHQPPANQFFCLFVSQIYQRRFILWDFCSLLIIQIPAQLSPPEVTLTITTWMCYLLVILSYITLF